MAQVHLEDKGHTLEVQPVVQLGKAMAVHMVDVAVVALGSMVVEDQLFREKQ